MKSLGERLAFLRKERALSQAEMARLLNMGQSTIAMYEKNKRRPDPETLQRLADFFDVSTDYLLGRADSRQKKEYPLQDETQARATMVLLEPGVRTVLADPIFKDIFKRLPNLDLTPGEKELLAQHWDLALQLIEKERSRLQNPEKKEKPPRE